MKKLILGVMLVAVSALGVISDNGVYELDRQGPTDRKYALGSELRQAQQLGVKATWNYAVQGGAISTINLDGADGKDVTLPSKAIITDCVIDVVTAPSSSGGTGTVALTANSSGDVKAAVDADTLANQVDCIPVGSAATAVKLTAARTLSIEIASEAMTAGKINVWLEYVLSE